MRREFADKLKEQMGINDRIWMLLGGVGFGFWEEGGQVLNCEASEVAMVNMAVGMAKEGKIPFVYAITPHLYRAFEQIRNYLDHEQIPVKLVGVGRDKDYGKLGFTHYAEEAREVFELFPNIETFWPNDKTDIESVIYELILNNKPSFISLRR